MNLVRLSRRLLTLIATGTTSVLIAACYGVNALLEQGVVEVWTRDGFDNPIEGLSVALRCDGGFAETRTTDANGQAEFVLPSAVDRESCTATITDVDGEENGGEFATETFELNNYDYYHAVTMYPK